MIENVLTVKISIFWNINNAMKVMVSDFILYI